MVTYTQNGGKTLVYRSRLRKENRKKQKTHDAACMILNTGEIGEPSVKLDMAWYN